MACNTLNIVECLRSLKTEPVAYSFSVAGNDYLPNNAIDGNFKNFFHSSYENKAQFWGVDFKKDVLIFGYQIYSNDWCHYISKWNFSVSMNNKTYKSIHLKLKKKKNTIYLNELKTEHI